MGLPQYDELSGPQIDTERSGFWSGARSLALERRTFLLLADRAPGRLRDGRR
jgi:hypothetical protein